MNDLDVVFLRFIESYLNGRMSAEVFSVAYIELWRIRRDEGKMATKGSYEFGGCIDSIFISADYYDPNPDREEYAFNESQLREDVIKMLNDYKNGHYAKN